MKNYPMSGRWWRFDLPTNKHIYLKSLILKSVRNRWGKDWVSLQQQNEQQVHKDSTSSFIHHWLDSPWWILAFLRSFAHSPLSRAAFFQFLTPSIRVSWSTPFSHRNFGLPTLLVPSGWVLNIFLRVFSLLIRIRCPAHPSLLTLI